MPCPTSCSKAMAGADHAVRRHPRLRHAQVQRHVRALRGEAAVALDDLAPVGVLERDHVALEAELVERRAVFERAGHHRPHVVAGVAGGLLGVDGAAVDAHAQRAVVRGGGLGDEGHLLARRLLALVVVQVAGVVANLVHVRRDERGQPVVLLQIDGERRGRARAHLRQRLDVALRVHGDAHQVSAGGVDEVTCRAVASTSCVRVAAIDCTAMGASPPIVSGAHRHGAGAVAGHRASCGQSSGQSCRPV